MLYLKYYLIICFGCLFFCSTLAQSAIEKPNNQALNDLTSTKLTAFNLVTYEEQAILQFQDILDYLSIVGSNKYKIGMRQAALKAVLANFAPKAIVHCGWTSLESVSEKSNCSVEQALEKLLESSYYEISFQSKNLKINNHLSLQKDGSYLGTISYEQTNLLKKLENSKQTSTTTPKIISLDFVLKRVQKQFGSEQELVWDVLFLGIHD